MTRPLLSTATARELAAQHFGLSGDVRELPSTDDRNFFIRGSTESSDGSEQGAVLKVVACAHQSEQAQRFEVQVLEQLQQARERGTPLPPTPLVLPARGGDRLLVFEDEAGAPCGLRAVSYLPGVQLRHVAHGFPMLHNFGTALGALDAELAGLDFHDEGSARISAWDLLQATEGINRDLGHVGDARRCRLVEDITARFVSEHESRVESLRRSWIHGDANDDNVLVEPASNGTTGSGATGPTDPHEAFWPSRISGLIDFGDLVHSATVCEPAIALTYLLLDGPRHRRGAPLSVFEHFLAAYHRQHPLSEEELEALFPLILHRLCFSVVRSARASKEQPENDYLQVSAEPAWQALERLAAAHPRRIEWTARHACGYEPVRHGKRLERWLEQRKAAPVMGVSLRRENTLLVDLSLTNPHFAELRNPADQEDVTAWTSQLLGVDLSRGIEPEGILPLPIGWGRWDEPRLVYAGEQFAGDPFAPPGSRAGGLVEDVDQQRTLHLGVDLFAPPGAEVFCPLDATVASIADNAEPYDYGGTVILEHRVALEFDGEGEGDGDGDGEANPPAVHFFTLFGHLDPKSLRHLEVGRALAPGDSVGRLGDPSCNGGWTPHLHFQIITDLLARPGEAAPPNFPGVAPAGERDLWLQVCPDPAAMLLGTKGGRREARAAASGSLPSFPAAVIDRQPVAARRQRHLSPNLSLSYRSPLLMVRGRGAALYDERGRRYVDLVNNVCHVGHAHPRVVQALREQATLLNTNTRYLHPLIGDYAERLLMRLPAPLEVCFFVNSGSEANDLALRLARTATRRELAFCLEGAYHGHTASLIDVSPYKHDGAGGRGTPGSVAKLPLPDPFRGTFRGAAEQHRYAAQAVALVGEICGQRRQQPAAVIVESILGCGGQVTLPPGYLPSLFEAVRERGGVCIADEVQVGFGRVGSHFWGFELSGVEPDIVTLGKPIGNGHPLAAVITTRDIATAFDNGMEYFNTFGGNPVSCAVGSAVLDVIEEENLQRHAWDLGRNLVEGLRALQQHHGCIGDVRGSGLFLGVELVCCGEHRQADAPIASFVTESMRERGYLLSTDGPQHNVLKIKPPLVLETKQAQAFLQHLEAVLEQLQLPSSGRCAAAGVAQKCGSQ